MEDDDGVGENPCDLTKPRIAPYKKYLDTSSKYNILVQFKARSGERIAILPNTVTCNRSRRHTARRLHWEGGMYESEGGALPESTLDSESTADCTQSEFAQRSTRSTRPRRKIILGPTTQRIEELQGNLEQRRTEFLAQQDTNRKDKVKKLIDKFESPPAQGSPPSGLEPVAEDQQVQRRIEEFHRRHEQHRDLQILRNLFQKAMLRLQYPQGNRHCLLQLRKIFLIFEKTKEFEKNNCGVSSIPLYVIRKNSSCGVNQTWTFWATENVLQG